MFSNDGHKTTNLGDTAKNWLEQVSKLKKD
jgi:hypothetical protein